MNHWIFYDAWYALMQKNYEMVEVLKFNDDDMNKTVHANRNLCMGMDKHGN